MDEIEWGYTEDLEEVIEGLSGVALLALHRFGIADPSVGVIMHALGIVEFLKSESEPRPPESQ